MAHTIGQIKREIKEQKKRISKESDLLAKISKRQKLNRELLRLKHRKLIGAGAKAKRLSKRFGEGLLKVGKKVAPVVKKQAKLIREQQLRDDALAKARTKGLKIKTRKRKTIGKPRGQNKSNFGIFAPLDF